MIMKKLFFILASAMLLFACSKEDVAPEMTTNSSENRIFHASFEEASDPETKVYADDKLRLRWNKDDMISFFLENNSNAQWKVAKNYEFDNNKPINIEPLEDGANSCVFYPVKDASSGSPLPYNYAVYPYDDYISISAEDPHKIGVILPKFQYFKEGSFGIGANTMVAVTDPESDDLMFKNVCGFIRLRLYGDNVKVSEVRLEGNNGEKLSGKALITPNNELSVEMDASAGSSVSIVSEDPVTLGSSNTDYTVFIFAIPPTSFTKGIKATVIGEDGKVFEKVITTDTLNIYRNKLKSSTIKVELTDANYSLVKSNEDIVSGDYVLAYHNGEGFNLFSFTKTMANAETAANNVKDVHGLSALLSKGSQIYATVVGKNYVTVEGNAGADFINITDEVEAEAKLSVTVKAGEANLTLSNGTYSLRLDKVITNINDDYSATLSVQPNAPDALNIMYSLRGGKVVITFNELINFAVDQAKKEGVTFTDEQIARLRSGFLKLCKLAKEELAEHNMGNLMDIDLSTNVFDVIAQYYDNAASYSVQIAPEKKFGWATPIGFYKGDDGFTANIALPQAGWFDRVAESLTKNNRADFVAYWAQYDSQYHILDMENFFQRLAGKFYDELDPSTYALLQQVDFRAIGRVYGRYVNRFNDKLEKVYLYKKVK